MKPLHEELKELRLEKGITLETINDSMKISMTILEKMETGDFSVVPRPFVRAFLREYAEVIGINPESVIARYENKTDYIIKTQPAAPEREPEEKEAAEPEAQPEQQEVIPEPRKKPKSPRKPVTKKTAASEPEVSPEVTERDSEKDTEQSSPDRIADDKKVIATAGTPHEAEKAESEVPTEINTVTVDERTLAEQTVPVQRQRLEIEESGPMHTVSIVIFVIIIIVAAVVIFWINRGF